MKVLSADQSVIAILPTISIGAGRKKKLSISRVLGITMGLKQINSIFIHLNGLHCPGKKKKKISMLNRNTFLQSHLQLTLAV